MDDHSVGSPPFQNILHLTDFSACSDAPFSWATALARANRARLSLLHVVVPDALTYMTPDSLAAALDLQEKWAQEQMERVEERSEGFRARDDRHARQGRVVGRGSEAQAGR